MPQTATIKNLSAAFRLMEAKPRVANGARTIGRARPRCGERAVARPDGPSTDQHLECMAEVDQADWYRRHPLTELGDFELAVPRTRGFSAPMPGAPGMSIA